MVTHQTPPTTAHPTTHGGDGQDRGAHDAAAILDQNEIDLARASAMIADPAHHSDDALRGACDTIDRLCRDLHMLERAAMLRDMLDIDT